MGVGVNLTAASLALTSFRTALDNGFVESLRAVTNGGSSARRRLLPAADRQGTRPQGRAAAERAPSRAKGGTASIKSTPISAEPQRAAKDTQLSENTRSAQLAVRSGSHVRTSVTWPRMDGDVRATRRAMRRASRPVAWGNRINPLLTTSAQCVIGGPHIRSEWRPQCRGTQPMLRPRVIPSVRPRPLRCPLNI